MGRAERRRLERQNRIEDRKNKVLMTRGEIRELKRDMIDKANEYGTEVLMTCFSLALHVLFGFGRERILRVLRYVDDLMGQTIDGTATIEDFKRELEEKTGVAIKCNVDDI